MKPLDLAAEPLRPFLVSIGEAARLLGTRKRAIWPLIGDGSLQTVALGGKFRVVYSSVEEVFLAARARADERSPGEQLENILDNSLRQSVVRGVKRAGE